MEASKDTSNISARSDQTTLEYHDAPTPEDMEDVVVIVTAKSEPIINKDLVPSEVDNLATAEMYLETQVQQLPNTGMFKNVLLYLSFCISLWLKSKMPFPFVMDSTK